MQIDTYDDDLDTALLIIGFIKEHCCISPKLLTFPEIIDIIQLFYFSDGPITNTTNTLIDPPQPTPTPEPMVIINEESHELKERNSIEPSLLLVDGYIRQISSLCKLSISAVINNLINSFYTKMNGTTFVWKIDNKSNLLNKLLSNAGAGTESVHFDSDVFEVTSVIKDEPKKTKTNKTQCSYCNNNGCCSHCNRINNLSLKYYLALFPNGTDTNTVGQFALQINLVSIPGMLESIAFIYNIYCHELNHCWSSSSNHNNFNADGKVTKCVPQSINTNEIKVLYELNRMECLTFYCTIDIGHVALQHCSKNNKYRFNPIYYFDKKYYLNNYKNAMFSKFMMVNDKWKCEWNLMSATMSKLKLTNISNTFIVSDIFFNMWLLTLDNKKIDSPEKDDIGTVSTIGLQLCSLPSNISSIVVQIKFICLQSQSKSCWSAVKKFNTENKIYRGQEIIMPDNDTVNRLAIVCDITVIEAFDKKGNEMSSCINSEIMDLNYNSSTAGHAFEPLIVSHGDLFGHGMREYFQHICISKDGEFEHISVEELHKHDRVKNPNAFFRNFTNLIDAQHIDNNSDLNEFTDLHRIGTQGWNFIPFEENKRKNSKRRATKLYYQHVGIAKPFLNKQNEELRFEDMYKKCASKQSSYNIFEDKKIFLQSKNDKYFEEMKENMQNLVVKISEMCNKLDVNKEAESVDDKQYNGNEDADEFKMWYDDKIGLDEYYSSFVENGWNEMEILDALTERNLIQMKIEKEGHKFKILRKIKELKSKKIDITDNSNNKNIQKIEHNLTLKAIVFLVVFILVCNMFLLFKD